MLLPTRIDLPADLRTQYLEAGEITHVLRCWYYAKPRKVPFAVLARLAGVDQKTLRRIVRTGFVRQDTGNRLTPIIRDILEDRLRFRRAGWQVYRVDKPSEIVRTPTRRTPNAAEFHAATQQGAPDPRAKNTT